MGPEFPLFTLQIGVIESSDLFICSRSKDFDQDALVCPSSLQHHTVDHTQPHVLMNIMNNNDGKSMQRLERKFLYF